MIKAEEISDIIKRQLQGYEAEVDLKEAGRVIEVGDGVARIYGLEKALAGELLEFPGGVFGLVLNLEADNVGAVLLGGDTQIKEGEPVARNKRIAQAPLGEAGPRPPGASRGCRWARPSSAAWSPPSGSRWTGRARSSRRSSGPSSGTRRAWSTVDRSRSRSRTGSSRPTQ